ncbi:MAG: hypoxanthine phosphoribosyltransferase [Chloroflexi bacterium]|nr:MAG: hypoxanthine phosphoribosyltransferase [Chloroflexota bacterium]
MQEYREFIDEIFVDEVSLQKRVAELGAQISRDYAGDELLVVCLLRGGLTFTADLTRNLTIPHELDVMSLSSYGTGHYASSGNVRVNLDLKVNIEGINVLLVEDIVDSGRTLTHVLQMLKTRDPKSLKVCVLLDKKERREVPVDCDYVGFDVPDKYIFGYGIDIDEHYRHLPFIATADLSKYRRSE